MTSQAHPIRSLLLYAAVVFLGGALIAPWIYWGVIQIHQSPFHRVFSRCLLVLGLLGIWPLLRNLQIKSWRDVGIVKLKGQWPRIGAGFVFAFATLAVVVLITMAAQGNVMIVIRQGKLLRELAGAAASALAVSVLEEILFRGTIFGGLRKAMDWRVALVVSSLIYAILHFMGHTDMPGTVTWHSGFDYLPVMFRDVSDPDVFIPAFFSLTLIGMMLGVAYQRTGNLYFSIGLHAGWIFWLKFHGLVSQDDAPRNWFFGSPKLIDGWLAFFVLALALPTLARLLKKYAGEKCA